MDIENKYLAGAACVGLLSAVGLYYALGSSTETPQKNRMKMHKYTKTVESLPLRIKWAKAESGCHGLLVCGDKKNKELGLKYGSLLIKVGGQRVALDSAKSISLKLKELKDFPVDLQFLESAELEAKWTKAVEHRTKGSGFYKETNLEKALEEYDAAIELHPTCKVLYTNKGLVLLKLDQPGKALEALNVGLGLDRMFSKTHALRGWAFQELSERAEELEEKHLNICHAVTEFKTSLRLNPKDKDAAARLKKCDPLKQAYSDELEARVKAKQEEEERAEKERMERMKKIQEVQSCSF